MNWTMCGAGFVGALALAVVGCGEEAGTADDAAATLTDGNPGTSNAGSDDDTAEPADSSGGGGGGGDQGLDPDEVDPAFSDEFDDVATLAQWTRGHEDEGRDAQYSTMDVNESTDGALTIVPTRDGWFGDFDGPLLFKLVSGDFIVETDVQAGNTGDPEAAPTHLFNSAGLLVRDPEHQPGLENWIMHNLGYQAEFVGSEGKTTVDSQSMLTLVEGPNRGRLRMCRIGERFILTRRLAGESSFTQTHEFSRPDLPDTLQVGLVANGWNSDGLEPDPSITPDLRASFGYIRLWPGATEADCLAD
ncbi:MAG: hypothetical protein AAF799_47560 [Myxococcota bacterium]